MATELQPGQDEVRTAEIVAALCLATDLGMGFPLEHGLQSTLVAMRLAERVGVDAETALQTYHGCLLFYIGCTADAHVQSELFDETQFHRHFTPVMFGTPTQTVVGIGRALTRPSSPAPARAVQLVTGLPRAVRGHRDHLVALCQVAQMLSDRLGMPPLVRDLFPHLTERWDGKGEPSHLRGEELPLALRIIHVAQDATLQSLVGGVDHAVRVVGARAGAAFDPAVVAALTDDASSLLSFDQQSAWDETLAREPAPQRVLRGEAIDRALAAMGDFADLISPYLSGHSAGVAELGAAAAPRFGLSPSDVVAVRRAALVHDVGRVAVSAGIWQKPGPLTADEWERVRLHAYHSERVMSRAPFLASLAPIASFHHERLDGSGYHRGARAVDLLPAARLLAAVDAFHTSIEPRPYRRALSPRQAAEKLGREASGGRLDSDSVAAVLAAAGEPAPRIDRPAGLTEREGQVVGLLARGLQTKQIARALGISAKTADHHVQNAYGKIGVSTRAAATVFAMEHGLIPSGELPMVRPGRRS